MFIHGLVVCVDYADFLRRSLSLWKTTLDSITIVTTMRDYATAQLAIAYDTAIYITDSFYKDGAYFNKGRAMQEARAGLPVGEEDWHLFFDADIVPPSHWQAVVERETVPGMLYGANRLDENGRRVPDGEIAGFFQLFHSQDPKAQSPLDCHWLHAGNYDTNFQARWDPRERVCLPLTVQHIGPVGRNWCGVGNEAALSKIFQERQRKGGWQHERIDL